MRGEERSKRWRREGKNTRRERGESAVCFGLLLVREGSKAICVIGIIPRGTRSQKRGRESSSSPAAPAAKANKRTRKGSDSAEEPNTAAGPRAARRGSDPDPDLSDRTEDTNKATAAATTASDVSPAADRKSTRSTRKREREEHDDEAQSSRSTPVAKRAGKSAGSKRIPQGTKSPSPQASRQRRKVAEDQTHTSESHKNPKPASDMASAAVMMPNSAASALFLLDEPEAALQVHALQKLNIMADSFWHEISPSVVKLQALSEDQSFEGAQLAALVAAKVLFHLGDLDEALEYALMAGSLFDVKANTVFALTLRARCIDEYITLQVRRAEESAKASEPGPSLSSGGVAPSSSLEQVVEKILDDCVVRGEVREALGVAIEARRLDRVEYTILQGCKSVKARMAGLQYCFECVQTLVASRSYRASVLRLVAELHRREQKPDEMAIARCLTFVGDAPGVAGCLRRLLDHATHEACSASELTALQIAFEMYENDIPSFCRAVADLMPIPAAPAVAEVAMKEDGEEDEEESRMDQGEDAPLLAPKTEEAPAESRGSSSALAPVITNEMRLYAKIRCILFGIAPAALWLEFLCSENKADMYVVKLTKASVDSRSSVCHTALIFANALMHAGTTVDTFLRENLDWLARATSWAKFSATACLGVIHARHSSAAMNILSPYLSSNPNASSSAYAEGGALFALGLISATGGGNAPEDDRALTYQVLSGPEYQLTPANDTQAPPTQYLLEALRNASSNEIIQHGACLGLGLVCMSSWQGEGEESEVYEELKSVLYTDSAVAGEATGVAMGLVAMGSGSARVVEEMLAYLRETEHEKIKRGLAMGVALVCCGCESDVDDLITRGMLRDADAVVRYAAMYSLGLAHAGTAHNAAIRALLHAAVSDVSDDVRRAAVVNLGFVLLRHPHQVPKTIALLAESCHAHVRYGAAMALGISCAGTGLPAAVDILERLVTDASDFVRQGALMALAMVLMQQAEAKNPKVADARKLFQKLASDKHEDVMSKFGAILATGLIDAGGRNVALSLVSRSGHLRKSALVGMALFSQLWFWFPYVHFLSLSLKPSCLMALTSELKIPKMDVKCNAPASLFAYPRIGPPEKPKEEKKVAAAVLSTTIKTKARLARKHHAAATTSMEIDATAAPGSKSKEKDASATGADVLEGQLASVEIAGGAAEPEPAKETEPSSYVFVNPSRVTADQERYISWMSDGRFQPVRANLTSGFVMLRDTTPGAPPAACKEMKTWPRAPAPPPPAQPPQTSESSPQPPEAATGTSMQPPPALAAEDDDE
ncbi:26S proteasome non-ATPase regulatory subunit 1-like A [Porphyridium purpureum]|uniref:26S proteasome non-ATPase regulatory subunit 1-like A n=1 Tax=Porphyridium purpureum TaxID=35688 RepID=A0A5J4Z8L1_PORPP|nr:26S proteasome non-ATPase regulatory subunit 1-like A [Porphyridium purpureum]|eukprot:POR5646..scf295_1